MRLTHYDEHKKRWQINNDHGAVTIDELNYAVGEAIDKLAAYEDADERMAYWLKQAAGGDLEKVFEEEA